MRVGDEDEIISYRYRVEPQAAYVPEDDGMFREPMDVRELGPNENGSMIELGQPGEQVQRVMRFSAGGIDED